jgi:ferredoxin
MPSVSIDGKSNKYQVSRDETIFEGLQKNDYELPHGCLSGGCGACRVEILKGKENLAEPVGAEKVTLGPLRDNMARIYGDEVKNKTYRLACQAKVISGEVEIKEV